MDDGGVAPGAAEELAGPPHIAVNPLQPVTRAERISSMDVLRGFSLMGILVMNITDFAYGFTNYAFPLSTVKPVFDGPHWKINTAVWFMRWIFAEGKMRAMFSMLFGAGVILLTERALARGAGIRAADIYTRRNLWLVVFGMLHGYLIWSGDILFYYGLAALLFLFPFRNVRVKRLMWVAGDPAGHQQRPGGRSRSTTFGLAQGMERPRPTPSSRNTSPSPKMTRTP